MPTLLNTRPISQSNQTGDAFSKIGFEVIDFPCIEIVEPGNSKHWQKLMSEVSPQAILIFTSQQAVTYAFKIYPDWIISPTNVVIAVGAKTALSLEQHIGNNIFVPEQHNSQGVIELVYGLKGNRRIILVSAENGRQEIQNYAADNNIDLTQINVYKRQLPNLNIPIEWINEKLEITVLATSVTILDNLKLMLNTNQWSIIQSQLFVCASSRIEKHAHEVGIKNTINTKSANPSIMAMKLKKHYTT